MRTRFTCLAAALMTFALASCTAEPTSSAAPDKSTREVSSGTVGSGYSKAATEEPNVEAAATGGTLGSDEAPGTPVADTTGATPGRSGFIGSGH